jgi:hypothetical protein
VTVVIDHRWWWWWRRRCDGWHSDDNFHKIMDAVKLAVKQESKFCTSLTLQHAAMQEELWKHEVTCVAMGGTYEETPDFMTLARRLDIFLDLLSALCCTNTPYLMSPRFSGIVHPIHRHVGLARM